MARSIRTYVLLLFSCLGACPYCAVARAEHKPIDPPLAALLPSEQAWLITLPFPPSAPAVMDDTRVYIPLAGEHFIALNRQTGETIWSVEIESERSPLVRDGVVYIAASDELHALDAATGTHKWRVPLPRSPIAALAMTESAIIALVTPDEVLAFRPADGSQLWTQSFGGTSGPASLAVDRSRIIVTQGSRVLRVDLANGAVRWSRTLPGMLRSPVLAGNRVFVGSTERELHALNADSGGVDWSFQVGGDVIGAATADEVVLVVSLDNVLRALKQSSGNQVWLQKLTMRPAAPPYAIGGIVAVPGMAPPLATFNAKTGKLIATLDTTADLPDAKFMAPTLVSSRLTPFSVSLVAITRDGRATGHRPVAMMFRDAALVPLRTLPGKPLTKEGSAIPRSP